MKNVLIIGGMNCGHCVKAVTEALAGLPDVAALEVEVGLARFEGGKHDESALRAALADAGFDLLSMTRES